MHLQETQVLSNGGCGSNFGQFWCRSDMDHGKLCGESAFQERKNAFQIVSYLDVLASIVFRILPLVGLLGNEAAPAFFAVHSARESQHVGSLAEIRPATPVTCHNLLCCCNEVCRRALRGVSIAITPLVSMLVDNSRCMRSRNIVLLVPCRDTDTCLIRDNRWKLCSFLVVPPLYFSLIVLLALRLRTQTDFIVSTEFRHTIEYAVLTFVIYLLMGTTYANGKQGLVPGRVFLTFCVCSLVFSHFWVRMGYPVYLCLLKPASAMDSFEEELRMSGARCLETIRMFSLINNRNRTGRVDSMQWPVDGLGLIRAIEGTKKEAAELKVIGCFGTLFHGSSSTLLTYFERWF